MLQLLMFLSRLSLSLGRRLLMLLLPFQLMFDGSSRLPRGPSLQLEYVDQINDPVIRVCHARLTALAHADEGEVG